MVCAKTAETSDSCSPRRDRMPQACCRHAGLIQQDTAFAVLARAEHAEDKGDGAASCVPHMALNISAPCWEMVTSEGTTAVGRAQAHAKCLITRNVSEGTRTKQHLFTQLWSWEGHNCESNCVKDALLIREELVSGKSGDRV